MAASEPAPYQFSIESIISALNFFPADFLSPPSGGAFLLSQSADVIVPSHHLMQFSISQFLGVWYVIEKGTEAKR
jgi:hypothetical protein